MAVPQMRGVAVSGTIRIHHALGPDAEVLESCREVRVRCEWDKLMDAFNFLLAIK